MANLSETTTNESLRPYIAQRILMVRALTRPDGAPFSTQASRFKTMSKNDWLNINPEEIDQLKSLCLSLREEVSVYPLENSQVRNKLTPNSGFQHHLDIMDSYSELLFDDTFTNKGTTLCKNTGISKSFFRSLILMHDMGRNVFNGLSVYHTDRYSHSLEENMFPNFPVEYLHSVEWITGTKRFPDKLEDLNNAQKVAIVLKVIDSISKFAGKPEFKILRGFTEMYKIGGSFEEWIQENTTSGRLPFKVKRRDENTGQLNDFVVDATTYKYNEARLSKLGAEVIESITGKHIDEFTFEVAKSLGAKYPEGNIITANPQDSNFEPIPVAV